MQGDAAGAGPGGVVDVEGGAEGLAPGAAEYRPGGDDVGGGVADAYAAEVDDRAKAPAVDQEVGSQQVAVDPARLAIPRGGLQGAVPGGQGGVDLGFPVVHLHPEPP